VRRLLLFALSYIADFTDKKFALSLPLAKKKLLFFKYATLYHDYNFIPIDVETTGVSEKHATASFF